jgi:predicted enzyme related to lactoylglutathione lyase
VRIDAHAPGAPCWVDLSTSDLDGARRFYAGLFGWEPVVNTDPRYAGYTQFHLGDAAVAGATAIQMPNQPCAWTVYLASKNVDQAARDVAAAGGHVYAEPVDIGKYGRMCVLGDPGGAAFGAWQADEFAGSELAGEPGTLTWIELMARDAAGSAQFYRDVFGWQARAMDTPSMPYTEFSVGGEPFGGMMEMAGDAWPADLPPHWMPYFEVADCDAAVRQVRALGGSVSVPPTDIQPGRFAVVGDPDGAYFSVLHLDRD